MSHTSELYPYPAGWYCLAPSLELKPGNLKTVVFAGHDYVLFRTASGEVAALDAYCPHLGAHMGKGGCVKGETVVCPFHGFRFDTTGQCVETAYGADPPARAKVQKLLLRERNGQIIAWHHPEGLEPTFEVPEYETTGWRDPLFKTMNLRSHPQEVSENSVDLGHLTVVHGYRGVENTVPVRSDGAYLTLNYRIRRKNPYGLGPAEVLTNFKVNVHGLGVSIVEIRVETFGLQLRLHILPTPERDGRITLRAGLQLRAIEDATTIHPLARFVPKFILNEAIQRSTLHGIANDVLQDFDIWENKVFVDPPILAKGDGPIAHYRRWCRQFYSSASAPDVPAKATAVPANAAE